MISRDVLAIDCKAAVAKIESALREQVQGTLRRKGLVVGLSGGIDSSVTAAESQAYGPMVQPVPMVTPASITLKGLITVS